MADIKFSEFPKANQSKDSDEIAILQDGVNKMIASPVLESKIINKTVSRVINQGGASLNVINLKGVVPTYADLATITPTPELNDAYQVEADGLVYVYTENGFQSDGEGFVFQPEPTGVVEEGNTQAVSGDEVFRKTLTKDVFLYGTNKYNYTEDINEVHINTTSGDILPAANSSVSKVYPLSNGDEFLYISNRTGNGAVRFLDASNNPIPPLASNGASFSPPYNAPLNGIIKIPSGAVSFQLTTGLSNVTNKENIIVKTTDLESVLIKEEFIPVTEYMAETRDLANSANSKIDSILADAIPNRLNYGENTNNPLFFPAAINSGVNFGIEILNDTESPTASIIGKKRRFFNNIAADKGTCFRIQPIELDTARPSKVSISFRAKRSELTDIFVGDIISYFGLVDFRFNLLSVINGAEQTISKTPDIPEYSSAKLRAKLIEEQNGWCRIELLFFDILWKPSFTGTFINYYFLFNGANFFEKTLDVSDWTLLFDEEVQAGVVYGGYNNEFPSNIVTLKGIENQISDIKNEINDLKDSGKLRILKTNTDLYISNNYSDTKSLVRKISINRQSTFTNNPNINFQSEYLINKGESLSVVNTALKTSNDDITPANLNGSYIAGGHSWNQGVNVVANSHGKTLADVGSVYKNASNVEFVILRVVDANNLWMISKNQSIDGFSYSFIAPSGTLTYVSNGTNTANITVSSSVSLGNTFTTISESVFKIILNNNVEATENKEYNANNVKIIEEYYVLDLPSIISDIVSNRPANGYTTQPQLNSFNSLKLFKHSIVYEVQESGCMLITTNFRTYNKKINFSFHGFIQAGSLATGNLYVPKSLPYVSGSKTYNLNLIEDWTTAPTTAINLSPTYWENPLSPPDRVLNMNTNVVFHSGYLTDRGVGLNRKDKVSNSMFLNTSRKLYPMGDSIARVMNENTSLNCVAFRDFQNPANNPIGRTSLTHFEIGNEAFVYVDYHGTLNDVIEVTSKWNGRKIEVYEQVGNVQLLTDIVSGNIEVLSSVSVGNYGFLILKIK